MLTVLIAIVYGAWILGFVIDGLTIWNVLLFITTTMFAVRRFGIHVGMSHIVTLEVVFIIFTFLWRLLFNSLSIGWFLLLVFIRVIFIMIVFWDETQYVYIKEEKVIDK